MKINNFQSELTDISAKKEALVVNKALSLWMESTSRRTPSRGVVPVPVLPFQPKYRVSHPKKKIFSLSKKKLFWNKVFKKIFYLILRKVAPAGTPAYIWRKSAAESLQLCGAHQLHICNRLGYPETQSFLLSKNTFTG